MNDATITVIGFVAQDPHFELLKSGMSLMSLRVGSTPRRYDRDIDLRITRLRKKIEPVPGDPTVIKTVRGHAGGYEYVPSPRPSYGR